MCPRGEFTSFVACTLVVASDTADNSFCHFARYTFFSRGWIDFLRNARYDSGQRVECYVEGRPEEEEAAPSRARATVRRRVEEARAIFYFHRFLSSHKISRFPPSEEKTLTEAVENLADSQFSLVLLPFGRPYSCAHVL